MCGIAGIVSPNEERRQRIAVMLDALAHRGPDDFGIAGEGTAVLGQRRLSIIDLAGGRQPIPNGDETLWIVCNGEIYNHESLRKELIAEGYSFRTRSDTEVILHLYERDGKACLSRLRGMFAFAIWDSRRRELFCARDHLGQKPFYYVRQGEDFVFASEIKALVAFDPGLRVVNRRALDQYLSLRIVCSPNSMFENIRKLPPAHTLTFAADGGLHTERYWDLSYEPKYATDESMLIDELEEKLIESLRLHMVSDVPVGAFLSGGLDSTLLVAMLSRHVLNEPIDTFTIGLPYRSYDESGAARLVAEQYGTNHHECVFMPSLIENLDRMVSLLDEPSDPLSICLLKLAGFASETVKVVIGGDGGDELFGGYDRYYGSQYASWYARIPLAVRRKLLQPFLRSLPDGYWYKSAMHQLKWLHALSFHEGGARYALALGYFYFLGEEQRVGLYGPELSSGPEPDLHLRELFDSARATALVDKMLYTDSFSRLPDHPVMLSDRMTMACSLECRSPFMDHKLVEFAARMPVEMKVRGRGLRHVQRRLAQRYLPKSVLARPKQGFSSALPYMLRDEFRILFDALLRRSELALDGYLLQDGIDRILEEHRAGGRDHGNRLWLLVSAEAWYRVHIKGAAPATLCDAVAVSGFDRAA